MLKSGKICPNQYTFGNWFWQAGHGILLVQQSQSLLYQSRVLPSSEGIYSETSRAACVLSRCGCCKCFTCITCITCFTVASRKRGRHTWLWYQPSKATHRIRLLQSAAPAGRPGRSAFLQKYKNIKKKPHNSVKHNRVSAVGELHHEAAVLYICQG